MDCRFVLTLLLSVCVLAISGEERASPSWVAVFLNETQRNKCKFLLNDPTAPYSQDVQCDHMTVEFNPKSVDPYLPYLGMREVLNVLAYGRDEYDQALLVELVSGPIVSTNYYPHITISDTGVQPYTPVYSSVVWERLDVAAKGPLRVGRDNVHNLPDHVSLPANESSRWSGYLPPINSTTYPRGHEFPASHGHVVLFFETLMLEGTLCVNYLWNRDTGRCEKH